MLLMSHESKNISVILGVLCQNKVAEMGQQMNHKAIIKLSIQIQQLDSQLFKLTQDYANILI